MKVLNEGHVYELDCVPEEGSSLCRAPLLIAFMERVNGRMASLGTTNEEVLRMLIDRMEYLQKKVPCKENNIVLIKLEEALMWLDSRTQKRIAQGVECTDMPHK